MAGGRAAVPPAASGSSGNSADHRRREVVTGGRRAAEHELPLNQLLRVTDRRRGGASTPAAIGRGAARDDGLGAGGPAHRRPRSGRRLTAALLPVRRA
jgi:hypothetical protein